MNSVDRYNQLVKKPQSSSKIYSHFPSPNDTDYERGFIRRYFIQKTNDKSSPIYEVSYERFGNYKANPIFTSVSIKWRIKGPKETQYSLDGQIIDKSVSESNRISIKLVLDKMPNLKLYLPNLLQFHK